MDEHHPETVALLWGPLMLGALSPPSKLPRRTLSAPGGMKPAPYSKLNFELQEVPEKLCFVSFYTVGDEVYTSHVHQI